MVGEVDDERGLDGAVEALADAKTETAARAREAAAPESHSPLTGTSSHAAAADDADQRQERHAALALERAA